MRDANRERRGVELMIGKQAERAAQKVAGRFFSWRR